MKDALRSGDKSRLAALRLALADIKRVEVDERIEPDDDRVLAILGKMVKQSRDASEQFTQGGRPELAAKEDYEISVLQEFMPSQLSHEEIEALIEAAVNKTKVSSVREMGKVMATLKGELQGRADLSAVSRRVKARLS